VPVADVVTPGHVITVPGEGLPRQDGTKVRRGPEGEEPAGQLAAACNHCTGC
jgi:hypothetical protein